MGKKTISDEKKVVVKSLVDAGNNYRKIREMMGVSLGAIHKIAKDFEADRELVEFYRNNKSDILLKAQMNNMALQQAIINSISDEDIKRMTANEKARWYQVLGTDHGIKFDKERLERGESTENIAHIHRIAKHIRDKQRGIKRPKNLENEDENQNQ
ncbi:hypothetical protein ACFL7E_02590 [Thermodesulfobacteriota bacterium]